MLGAGSGGMLRRIGREAARAGLERTALRARLLWRLPEPVQAVALTFDDGPHPDHTPRVLDLLKAAGARATFFVVGERALRYPELVRRMAREGHAVGNHTFSHRPCRGLPGKAFAEEVRRADAAIRSICAEAPLPIFRPPFGSIEVRQALKLAAEGRTVALWSRDSRDYRATHSGEVRRLGEALGARDIVLLHDRLPVTVEALEGLLEGLARRGLGTVTLSG